MNKEECTELLTKEFHKLKASDDLEEWHQEFASYCNMLASCYDPDHPRYKDEGGKGVTVSEQWQRGFQEFLKDVGPSPEHKKEIELDGLVLAEATRLLESDQVTNDYLRGKIEEIQDDMKNGRAASEADAVKFTAIFLVAWYQERVEEDPTITLARSIKLFKRGDRP